MASRLSLATQARIWRGLENIGMGIERWTGPTQATHSFTKTVTISEPFVPGTVEIYFYIPPSYINRKPGDRFPTFLNFHGGGFTIGDATDDARWAHDVIRHLDSLFVSANYRLAPEFPYPVAVQDGACVLHFLATHAEELGIDKDRVVTCGFSAGGTLSITGPMLYNALHQQQDDNPYLSSSVAVPEDWFPEHARAWAGQGRCKIRTLAAFYPAVDFTLTREQRRITNPSPSHNLSEMLTGLFDASFLPLPEDALPPDTSMIKIQEAVKQNEDAIASGNPILTLTRTVTNTPEDSLSGTTTGQRNTLSRTTTAPSATLTPSDSRNLSRTTSTLSGTISESRGSESEDHSGPPSLSTSKTEPTTDTNIDGPKPSTSTNQLTRTMSHKNPLSRTVSSRSARPSPVKMSSGLLGRSTSARPIPDRTRSALSVRSFRSYQGDKARPHPPKSSNQSSTAASEQPIAALFDPFLSPAQASASTLTALVPDDCVLYTCEYDMLQAEGERFAGALAAAGKRVCYKKVSRVPHAWDKSPGIISWGADAVNGREKVAEVYMEVCGVVGATLNIKAKVVDEVKGKGRRSWLFRRGSKQESASADGSGDERQGRKPTKAERRSIENMRRESKEMAREQKKTEKRKSKEDSREGRRLSK